MEVLQNILILDDEIGFREELGEFLKEEGYYVYTSGLPSEALKIISNNDIDIADARKDFTVLLNRSGRRKFYQQQNSLLFPDFFSQQLVLK